MSNPVNQESVLNEISQAFRDCANQEQALETCLAKILAAFDCPVGTIHTLEASTNLLHLRAKRGIPDFILDKVKLIPVGKGMAGIAAERKEAVQICNLQTDNSGVAKPSAKETKMEGSITAPMLINGVLYGTLGIAKPIPYEFSEHETATLMEAGKLIATLLK